MTITQTAPRRIARDTDEDVFVIRPHCVVCDSSNSKTRLSRPFTDPAVSNFIDRYYNGRVAVEVIALGRYEVAECLDCGLLWQTQILNDHWMDVLYSEWICAEQSRRKKRDEGVRLAGWYAQQAEVIAHLVHKPPHETRVLDFGMGWGHWCRMAKAYGYDVSGFELSQERIAAARSDGIHVIDHFDKLANASYDFINTEQVFEHLPSPRSTLAGFAESLATGGVVRISVPNGYGIKRRLLQPDWQASKDPLHPLEHINCFTHRVLVELSRNLGLELIEPPLLGSRWPGAKRFVRRLLARLLPRFQDTAVYFRKAG